MAYTKGEKTEQLRAIRDEVWALSRSPLYSYRKENNYYAVLGEGSHDANLMFIGEAPGENEAKEGRPFCGRAGKLLDYFIEGIGLARSDVYITNIVKDRPPANRDPLGNEIELYAPYLDRQIEVIEPKIVVTLGRFSLEYLFGRYVDPDIVVPISKAHGRKYRAEFPYGEGYLFPLYHPAAALYNPSTKEILEDDFSKLKNLLNDIS